jgi:predicted  nucleic acid-binding Zn-ribbon protein
MATVSANLRRAAFLVLTPLVSALLLAGVVGCGSPDFTYVENSSQKTYFKVPAEWHQIDRDSLDQALSPSDEDSAAAEARRKLVWAVAYDADASPSARHLFGATAQPFVYATVIQVAEAQRGAVSFDSLRNVILPVTDDARRNASTVGFPLQGFELLGDDVLTPGAGIHGVHAVFNYRYPDGSLQTFDQTAYASDDASRVYIFLVRCSARCYRDRHDELNLVARSFTVRSQS